MSSTQGIATAGDELAMMLRDYAEESDHASGAGASDVQATGTSGAAAEVGEVVPAEPATPREADIRARCAELRRQLRELEAMLPASGGKPSNC